MTDTKNTLDSRALLIYLSHDACSVCKVLKPKIEALLKEHFPMMNMHYVDTKEQPEVAAQHQVFTVPTILIFFEGKEYFRFSRSVSIDQIKEAIQRPYSML